MPLFKEMTPLLLLLISGELGPKQNCSRCLAIETLVPAKNSSKRSERRYSSEGTRTGKERAKAVEMMRVDGRRREERELCKP